MNKWNEFKQWIEDQDDRADGIVAISIGSIQKKMHEIECVEQIRLKSEDICIQCYGYRHECLCVISSERSEAWNAEATAWRELFGDMFVGAK